MGKWVFGRSRLSRGAEEIGILIVLYNTVAFIFVRNRRG